MKTKETKNAKNGPNKEGRDTSGRFIQGFGGRPKGALNKTTREAQALLEANTGALTALCIEKALDGDMAALRLCMERILPPVKDRPVSFSLPDSLLDLEQATRAGAGVLDAMAAGGITPHEAAGVMAILRQYAEMAHYRDIEEQLEKLIDQDKGQKQP